MNLLSVVLLIYIYYKEIENIFISNNADNNLYIYYYCLFI